MLTTRFTMRCLWRSLSLRNTMTTPPVQNKNTKHALLGKMKNSSLYFFCALAIAMLAVACKKEESNIGANLAPDGDKLNVFTYEVPLQFKTIYEDSLATSGFAALLAGSYYDPIFGRTSAALATEFKLETAIDFGINPHIDSVVLSMEYLPSNLLPCYGDAGKLNGAQRFSVYELTETLSTDSTYYSAHHPQYSTLLGEKVFVPNFTDTVKYVRNTTTIKENPQLRIKLDANRFQNLLASNSYTSTDAFYSAFKGLYILPNSDGFQSTSQGAILRFNAATDRACRIRIFYQNAETDTSTNEPFKYADLVVMTGTRRYQVYNHAYNGTEAQTAIQAGTAAQKLYVQGIAGVKTKIILPNFDTIADFISQGIYVVNLAELVIPVDETTYSSVFPVCSSLSIAVPSDDAAYANMTDPPSSKTPIADAVDIPASYYGGVYDPDKKEYVFRISLHMANILNKLITNKGLYLVCGGSQTVPQRVVISNTAGSKIHLRLTYTKI